MSQGSEISDAMIHALDTALLAYVERQYLGMAARGAFDHAPDEDQGTPTIS